MLIDLGLLILRLGVGAILIAHGLQKAFGLWGGPGLNGWADSLSTMGFKYADILTYVATGGQIAAGVLLVLGLFTPVAAAGALAYLVTGLLAEAMAAHEEARLASFLIDGHEYQVFLALVQGRSLVDIAAELHLSAKTVSTHKFRLMRKLGLNSVSELVRYAVRHGIVE